MQLRFDVDQAECFRRGIDCPKSIVTVEVNPAELTQEQRNLIADRMKGIDVLRHARENSIEYNSTGRIVAKEPTFAALMEAVEADERAVSDRSRQEQATKELSELADFALNRNAD